MTRRQEAVRIRFTGTATGGEVRSRSGTTSTATGSARGYRAALAPRSPTNSVSPTSR